MGPIGLIKFLLMLRSFALGAGDLKNENKEMIAALPAEFHPLIKQTGRRILRFAYLGVFMSLVVLPVAAPLAVMLLDGIRPTDALCRGILLLALAPMTFFLGAYWGLSLGMLTSPDWYLGSDLGLRWRQMCGAESERSCRSISLVVTIVGAGCYVLLFWLTRTMAPFA